MFERRARADGPIRLDFVAIEAAANSWDELGSDVDRLQLQAKGLPLAYHWVPAPTADGAWQTASSSFFTTRNTHAIWIELREPPDDHAVADPQSTAWFDDLRVVRLDPRPDQQIALMKARHLADGADPSLGIEKFGQFPPRFDIRKRHDPLDDNFSYRHALYAPPPTDLTFALRLPPGAKLRFSVALSEETRSGDAARFEVAVGPPTGPEEVLWSRTLAAQTDEWRWFDASLDLSEFGDRAVRLTLRTTATAGHPHPVWGHPVVDAPPTDDGVKNVVLIAVDTLRADRLSCYGYESRATPRIDRLAQDGVRFDQVASNANWTCPSFASIFTGLSVSRHGVNRYGFLTPLRSRWVTLAERFRAHGWATHSIAYKPPLYDGGYDQGFDVSFNVPKDRVRADDNLAEALEWLAANHDRRNFLFLHFNDPHQPFTQPPPYDGRPNGSDGDHPLPHPNQVKNAASAADRERVRELYDGEIAYLDDRIGAFLDELEARGLYDEAVIGFVSDHGEQLWEHGAFGHSGSMLWDEVVRVPLIVKPGAGDFARATVIESQVRGFDIMPTLLELAGIPVEEGLDAESLVPLLRPGAEARDRLAIIECSRDAIAVRTSRWKYITSSEGGRKELLFDLERDPGETENVGPEHATELERFRLHALDHQLKSRPNALHLVAIGDGRATEHRFVVDGVRQAHSLYGLPVSPSGRTGVTIAGRSPGPLLAVVRLGPSGTMQVDGDRLSARRYEAGDLEQLVRARRPGFTLFEGPPVGESEAEAVELDARTLEAMKALGYIGED